MKKFLEFLNKQSFLLAIFVVSLASIFVYFFNYNTPNSPYWDENYHIASAEKYLTGTFFFEPHPPLGKMLIALGEKITGSNKDIDKSGFTKTDYIKEFPKNYSFFGVRLIPTIFAVLASILFFVLLFLLSRNLFVSLSVWIFYLFDTATLLHFRGAMLDGIQMAFALASIIFVIKLLQTENKTLIRYILFGLFVGLAISVKLNGLFLIILYIFLIPWREIRNFFGLSFWKKTLPIIYSLAVAFLTILAIYIIHLSITKNIIENRTYELNKKSVEIVRNDYKNPLDYIVLSKEYLDYQNKYNEKVPKLKLQSSDENGSPPITWPLGIKNIRYRYDTDWKMTSYLYLTPNPIVWSIGLVGLFLSFSLIISKFLFGLKTINYKLFTSITVFCVLYLAYMIPMLFIERVMYLYHYLPPLMISLILFVLVILYMKTVWQNKKAIFNYILLSLVVLAAIAFFRYSPLVYYSPISCSHLKSLEISPLWQMDCPIR